MKFPKIFILCVSAQVLVRAQEIRTNVLTPRLINELAEEARTNNAALWAGRARVTAAEQNAKSIALWRNPEVMVGGMAAEQTMRADDGDLMYGVEQMLPIFGKEQAARNAARLDIASAEADFEYQYQILRKTLAQALFEAALADEMLTLSQEDLTWLQTLQAAVEQRYQAGDASQVDVLRVQNERSRRAEMVVSDENRRHAAYVTVNRLLNRSTLAGWPEMHLPDLPGPVPFTDRLVGLATKFDPKLRVMHRQLATAQAAVNVSRKEARPDLSAAIQERQYSGTGESRSTSFLLKMTIPWVNRDKYKAAVHRDEARVQETEYLIEDYTRELQAEIHHLTTRIDNARREALLYRDQIIPRTEQALRSAQAAWQSSRDVFRDVLDTRRMLIEARSMYLRAVAEQYSSMAELILCCGLGDFEALEMLGQQDRSQPSIPSQP